MSKRNENRPGYKKTKVGWIPEEWECVRIKNIAQINPRKPKIDDPEILVTFLSMPDISEEGNIISKQTRRYRDTAVQLRFE